MVMTRHRAGGSGSGSCSDISSRPIDEGLREFIPYEITRGMLDATLVIFESIKEGIMEVMEDCLQILGVDQAVSQSGAHTLSFKDFTECRAPYFFGVKDPITTRCWIADIECAQMTSFCPKGSNIRFDAGCLREPLEPQLLRP